MAKSNNSFLEMRGIVKDFPGVRALDHVDFSLKLGEVHCLLGENGAGKSTLIKILTGVLSPDEGEISFKSKVLHHITPRSAQQVGISAIYQEFQLVPTLSIAENVFLGREPITLFGKIDYKKMRADTIELFKRLEMDVDPSWLISDVSTGLRQMTEVIKILGRGSQVVIMDEPTTSLNETETTRLFNTIKVMKERNISIIYISHRMEEIFEIGDRASVLRDGKLIGTEDIDNTTSSKLISMMVGRTINEKYYKEKVKIGEVLWKGENISNETGVVTDVDFEVREGEILGLVGIRGSGFKELARIIGGIEPAIGGYLINQKGEKLRFNTPQDAIQAGIGYLPDDRKGEGLVLSLSINKNIVMPIIPKISKYGWVNDKEAAEITTRHVEELNIQARTTDQLTEFLSGGNQQKVVFAKWIASKCKLLVLDAPTQGIDVGAKIEMYKLISNHVRNGGSVIFVSSELAELLSITDRIMIIRQGKVVGTVITSQSTQEQVLHLAAAGQEVFERERANADGR
jgi:ABC-type sugar transport system ATPase subunit